MAGAQDWSTRAHQADHGNGEPVRELWAWVKVYGPDDEGLAAIVLPGSGPLPPVFASQARAERFAPLMAQAQRQSGTAHVLRRYVLAPEPSTAQPGPDRPARDDDYGQGAVQ